MQQQLLDDASHADGQPALPLATEEPVAKDYPVLPSDCTDIYRAEQMLEAILKIKSNNYSGNEMLSWGQIRLHLQTKSLEELQKKYNELNVTLRQIGVDEDKNFVEERILIGEKLLQKDYQPFLVQFAKRGVPPTLRKKIYSKILYAEVTQREADYFQGLCDHVKKYETALDELIIADTREFCNDDKFFIFEDSIEECITAFFVDRQIYDQLKHKPHAPVTGLGGMDKSEGLIPLCGVAPCFFFARYIGPVCYISPKKEECYFIFRALYTKYFCHLHSISSHPQSIISLCKLFEDLLQMYEPEVCYHLNTLGISPLRVAFPWMFYSFIGYLEVDQIFLLWDRILGFESLEILPIFATAIFVFRANLILNCSNQEEFEELFYDFSQIKVMPLIQHFLFATGIN